MLQHPLDWPLLHLPAESYVMRMYCPCIAILGYTSQSRKFEKFINIHLNRKTLRRSSGTHFNMQPPEVFYKKAVLENLQYSPQKNLCWSLFLIKLQTIRPVVLLNRDPTQVFSWKYFKIFKNIYFEDHLQTATSASWSILYKKFVDIRYEIASFDILEDSTWLQFIYFF